MQTKTCILLVGADDLLNAEKAIKSVRGVHAGPILFLSASFSRGNGPLSHLARPLGVRTALPKPFTRDELLAAVAAPVANEA